MSTGKKNLRSQFFAFPNQVVPLLPELSVLRARSEPVISSYDSDRCLAGHCPRQGGSFIGGPLDGLSVSDAYDSDLRRTALTVAAGAGATTLSQTGYGYDAASRLASVKWERQKLKAEMKAGKSEGWKAETGMI